MEHFSFSAIVCNQNKVFSFDIPTNSQGVITNRFCPKAFLVPQGIMYDSITPINGESLFDFKQDCQNLASCMTNSIYKNSNNKWDIYTDSLDHIIATHINRCGRLLFNDLLIYLDIYSYFLYADGVNEKNIKLNYPRFANQYLKNIPELLKDSSTFQPLIVTKMSSIIKDLSHKAEIELGI